MNLGFNLRKFVNQQRIFLLPFPAGSARNVYFPFDIFTDTPINVAKEMVKELDIKDWDPSEIALMIEAEISMLLPDRTNSYHDDENDEGPHQYHHFPSVSSCSSSQESLSGAVNRADDISNGYRWHHGMSSFPLRTLHCGCPISLMS